MRVSSIKTMSTAKRGWRNPAKHPEKGTKGKCPACGKNVDNIESHKHDKHMSQ
jgi:hypothetical protein